MPYGRLSAYSNKDLLHILTTQRLQSPIIDELCNRLENSIEIETTDSTLDTEYNCPICECALFIKVDEDKEFTLVTKVE